MARGYNIRQRRQYDFAKVLEVAEAFSDSFEWRKRMLQKLSWRPGDLSKADIFELGEFMEKMLRHSKAEMATTHYDDVCKFRIFINSILLKC
ncbi:MAG: hypothetical protein UT21_C0006G0033 [Candidatus Woesebacteria bacterium GW2011_GWA1_39_11b]|nr:MAG: hypothetical protein UT21_C0006G0033 [Candidatus Woesebacteria bacterium GW2011_GWA1_39_11b]KKS77111.1 MAG: hypothetical protein UV51_C0010G0016 [Candidatus Woesebacteria bacterium GW2011_GWC1_42_9]